MSVEPLTFVAGVTVAANAQPQVIGSIGGIGYVFAGTFFGRLENAALDFIMNISVDTNSNFYANVITNMSVGSFQSTPQKGRDSNYDSATISLDGEQLGTISYDQSTGNVSVSFSGGTDYSLDMLQCTLMGLYAASPTSSSGDVAETGSVSVSA